ncbi:hypothetical protein CHUAL_001506 [Chamberlinius hualienensis]
MSILFSPLMLSLVFLGILGRISAACCEKNLCDFCNTLFRYGLCEELGLPPDVDTSKIVLVNQMNNTIEEPPPKRTKYAPDNNDERKETWTKNLITLLIETRIFMNDKFLKASQKHRLWNELADKINHHSYHFTGTTLDEKWRSNFYLQEK